ncbi:hypothetical protein D8O27_01210 [Burkholderia mallei]|uniref:Uncharacterized protein n=2 Tax=pseudomallei group TaxID=111527 RepID=A0AAX1X204_BURML|nr:hypothetical protein BOC35_27885 [Burkholderia pseudomallei]EBA48570.1 conserved hypothetical protein [Burkholderia pseudomallei 305]EDO86381.1 hypothetical protein BURPS406E_K0082 [Burkholderia pseudomallei 406e]EDO95150.1 hypothetical protein BURPSPAST_AB0321 [Burkholderia pseudomallei Pasteur 52237]EDS85432.1 hypothetical protein BURPSS13_N0082 [Burkholderia pseudomallei S13]PNW94031.1 hypothetical protein CF649_33820 [Burkholderia sp. 136(2017)]PNX10819.1 hypothetical protein CF650_333
MSRAAVAESPERLAGWGRRRTGASGCRFVATRPFDIRRNPGCSFSIIRIIECVFHCLCFIGFPGNRTNGSFIWGFTS